MEEDIKILEETIKFSKEQFENTGIYTHLNDKEILAIEHLISRNKELEKYYTNEKVIWKRKDYIPKSKVIEILDKYKYVEINDTDKIIQFYKEVQQLLED